MKLLFAFVGLVAVAELLTVAALDRSLSTELVAQLSRRLEDQAKGSIEWISVGRHPGEIATRLANIVDARVTIIGAAGLVVGDSTADADDEDGEAPEVSEARAGRIGRATRWSKQAGQRVHYVAVPTPQGTVIRLAAPLSDVNSTIALMRRQLLLTSALVFLLAVALSLVAARLMVRPLVAMRDAAQRIAEGAYDIELPPGPKDEFGDLGRSLKALCGQLAARIGEIVAERDRLQAVLASMIEGVIVLDRDGKVQLANPSAERLLGAGALVARPLDDIVTKPLRAVFAAAERSGRDEAAEIEDGERVLAATVQPLHDGGTVAVLQDVTAPRRVEALRRQFVGDMSHEIRTPVTAIQGYAETLLSGRADQETSKEFLEIIHRHARRIGRLVDDLLFLSSLEARSNEQRVVEAVPLLEVARHVAETVRPRAQENRAVISLAVDADVAVLGDADQVERVLLNLVDNAVKYGGSQVTVRASKQRGRIVLEIVDNGPGISAEHIGRVFDRFYRVDQGRSRDKGGTGLGLAIVKQLAEAMGGTASVTSEVGKGARFAVELPSA